MDDPSAWPLGRLLSTAARLVEHEWNERLARHGLTHAGVLALHALQQGPHTQRQLAALNGVEEQTMRTTLERLVRIGYVTRERDPRDGRRLIVRATERGLLAYREANAHELADRLVATRLADPERFRDDLQALVRQLRAARRLQPGERRLSPPDTRRGGSDGYPPL